MIPVNTMVAMTLPGHGGSNPTLDGQGRATWALGDATKHTAICTIPTKRAMFFGGTDHNSGVPCDNHGGNHGSSTVYRSSDNSWKVVGGACRASGEESPVGMDEAILFFCTKDGMIYGAGNASGEMNHEAYETICDCGVAFNGPGGNRSSGSQRRRGALWRIDPGQSEEGEPNWRWDMLIHAGTPYYDKNGNLLPPPNNQFVLPWSSGTHYDPVTHSAVSVRNGDFAHLPMSPALSRDNPGNAFYPFPIRDPDSPNNCTGVVGMAVSGNRFAIDVIGRWAYFFMGGAVIDPLTCDVMQQTSGPHAGRALSTARFYRYNLDSHRYQKLPDFPIRVYAPSASLPGGPYNYHGYTSEIDANFATLSRTVLFLDHGLEGPDGNIETGIWAWDTTIRATNSPAIREWDDTTKIWEPKPAILHAGAWRNFPVNSTEPNIAVRANEECYDTAEDVLLFGGGGFIERTYQFKYKRV